jgi:hypothetical protein
MGERVLEDGHSYIRQILEIKANVSFYLYDLSDAATDLSIYITKISRYC